MREIKFRAWDKVAEKMRLSFNPVCHGEWDIFSFSDLITTWERGTYELMQYTGLKDKNGKEIYEGDIVREDIEERTYQVVFSNGGFMGESKDNKILFFGDGHVEVIGNIYENPELLKKNNNTTSIQGI